MMDEDEHTQSMTPESKLAASPGDVNPSPQEELNKKEEQQKKHYYYLSQLQNMARELPAKYQQRLPYDLLTSLANALLDGTVFEIVSSLREVQQLEERNLSNQRLKLISEHKTLKSEMKVKHREAMQACHSKPHTTTYVKAQCEKEMESLEQRCEEELKRKDMKVILELDQQVMDQQVTLERAGVPGFCLTNNPQEQKLQMYFLDFIHRLSQLTYPP